MKQQIKKLITDAIRELYPDEAGVDFVVDYAPDNIAADFASNVALILAKAVGKKPMEVAEALVPVILNLIQDPDSGFRLGGWNDKQAVTVAPPGFLNFQVTKEFWHAELAEIFKAGQKYGQSTVSSGKKARVEYVSANPTGPIHIGNARGGPYGEVICNVLEQSGFKVLREYIHNDIGGQVEKLGQTVWYWYQNALGQKTDFPEGGYQGEYLKEVAAAALKKLGNKLGPGDQPKLLQFALDYIFEENLKVLEDLGVKFDQIVKESELKSSGKVAKALADLKKQNLTTEKEGAIWFAPNDEFLADREAVVVKSNGETTYFASDIAYHKEKFTSGYDLVIDIFGSNHHGHVPKLMALTKIYGFKPQDFKVLLYQYVRIKRGREVVKMSKRAGNYVTAKEVLEEVGKDSMIFTLLSTAINTHVDFDLDLAKDTSEKNPVFRVLYAYARINSIFTKAGMKGPKPTKKEALALLQDPVEINLIKELAKYPALVSEIARSNAVHQLPHYLLALADKFHTFYEQVRVITEEPELTQARLALVAAVQTVLGNGLLTMGIRPREKM